MKRVKIGLFNILILLFLTSCFMAEAPDVSAKKQAANLQTMPESVDSDSIQYILAKVVNDGQAPGMIAAIISSKGVIAMGSAGERKAGSGIAFTTNDLVHLGSCTKAMTATMLATLVAEGKLSWDTKIVEAIPKLKELIDSSYYNITLWQLITHRAGLSQNAIDWGVYIKKEIKERRLEILKDNLKSPVTLEVNEFHYSNLGYMVAACMAEQITGLSWEILMRERIFDPLGMSSAGFGAPNSQDQINQPWGHEKVWYWYKWKSDQTDNSEALGPAGRVHCNLEDWAKFLSLQLTNENPILDRKFLDKLIEPVGDHFYAGGWGVAEFDWAKGTMLSHDGSNGVWYTTVVLAPKLDRGFIVSTNSMDFGVTPNMCREITNKLIKMGLNTSK